MTTLRLIVPAELKPEELQRLAELARKARPSAAQRKAFAELRQQWQRKPGVEAPYAA